MNDEFYNAITVDVKVSAVINLKSAVFVEFTKYLMRYVTERFRDVQ